jgi:hypothetical protein
VAPQRGANHGRLIRGLRPRLLLFCRSAANWAGFALSVKFAGESGEKRSEASMDEVIPVAAFEARSAQLFEWGVHVEQSLGMNSLALCAMKSATGMTSSISASLRLSPLLGLAPIRSSIDVSQSTNHYSLSARVLRAMTV